MKFRVLLLAVFCALIASCSDEDVQRLPEAIANLSTK